jgi:hypothetical protein
MKRYLYQILLAVIGLALSCVTIFAQRLGLAHNTIWGSGRILLLIVGISVFTMSFLAPCFKQDREYLLTTSALLFVLVVYVFIITNGRWISLPESSQHYDELATAFLSGHLYLNIQPPAVLLALPDPYDPQARRSNSALVTFIEDHAWDLSFYHDRFYMYWGPTPALLLSIVKLIYVGPIGDQILAFLFGWGALIFQTLLLIRIWFRFFPHLPSWTLPLGITTVGLIVPTVWMLNMPRIYQAAILSCQFFLMAGLYFAYKALEAETLRIGDLWVAGLLWALAIASRVTILGSILFLIGTMVFILISRFYRTRIRVGLLSTVAPVGIPVVIALIALGWYNTARYGSVTEFGMRYDLTLTNLYNNHGQLFSSKYVLANLYNYTVLPFQTQSRFPFIKAQRGVVPRFLGGPSLDNYQTEDVTGIFFSLPFSLFIFWPIMSLAQRFSKARKGTLDIVLEDSGNLLRWISISLLGASIISFATLLTFLGITMRYMADFTITLAPLAVMGFWQGLLNLKPVVKRIFFSMIGILLSWLSIGIGMLLIIGNSRPLQNIFFFLFRLIAGFFR